MKMSNIFICIVAVSVSQMACFEVISPTFQPDVSNFQVIVGYFGCFRCAKCKYLNC